MTARSSVVEIGDFGMKDKAKKRFLYICLRKACQVFPYANLAIYFEPHPITTTKSVKSPSSHGPNKTEQSWLQKSPHINPPPYTYLYLQHNTYKYNPEVQNRKHIHLSTSPLDWCNRPRNARKFVSCHATLWVGISCLPKKNQKNIKSTIVIISIY